MNEPIYQRAPEGLTSDQRREFDEKGFLIFKDAIPREDIERYLAAMERVASASDEYDSDIFLPNKELFVNYDYDAKY